MAQTARTRAGGRPRRLGRRQRVISALVRHGLTERAARALYRLGLALRRRMLQTPDPALWVEHAGMVDVQTGRRLGAIAVGVHGSVTVTDQLRAAQGHCAASLHTHPGSSSLSADDVALLLEEAALQVVAVVGGDSTWYVLSVAPGGSPPAVAHMERRYDATVKALAPAYRALVWLGSLTRDAAWRELTHQTWQTIAPALGLRYTRIEAAP